MLLGNILANLGGVAFVEVLLRLAMATSGRTPPGELLMLAAILRTVNLLFILTIQIIYELPLRKVLRNLLSEAPPGPQQLALARRRLLNAPYFATALDLLSWGTMAMILALVAAHIPDAPSQMSFLMAARSFLTGIIAAAVAFFILERVLQRLMIPILFPQGGLTGVGGVIRITIVTRLGALVFAASIVPFATVLVTIYGSTQAVAITGRTPEEILTTLQAVVAGLLVIFIFNAVALTFLISTNITRPIREIMSVIHEIKLGKLDRKVRVVSNDEIGYTGEAVNLMMEGLKDRDLIKETFGKYVSREVRDEILAGRIPLDGEVKNVTVLFSDLRDFTQLVATRMPQEVVAAINNYFEEMACVIQEEGGLVLQFIGDEIEAVFGAPLPLVNHADRAVHAALQMRERLEVVNQSLTKKGWPPLRHGIGIHTGPVLAANIGSQDRLSYALVGSTVNLTSRIQELTKMLGYEILISVITKKALQDQFELLPFPATTVKGMDQPVEVLAVIQ